MASDSVRTSRPRTATQNSADSFRSGDNNMAAGGTSRSDPGGGMAQYNAGAVCIDEKVLKQISENQTKVMQERISHVEEHFGNLCEGFAKYARGIAKLRDRGDAIAQSLLFYANKELLNPRTQDVLIQFGKSMAAISDYRESEVRRIEDKVVKPLSTYGNVCKQAKERMKVVCAARKKELDQKKAIEKSRDFNPWNRQQLTKGQTDLQKASVNASQAADEVEQEMEKFEERKLQDVKQMVKDYVTIEMLFHSKALEIFSDCFQQLDNLQELDDLEFFRNSLRPMTSQTRMSSQRQMQSNTGTGAAMPGAGKSGSARSGNANTLTSTGASDWSSSVDSRPPRGNASTNGRSAANQRAQPSGNNKQQARNTNYDDQDEEEDEDLDDEEEEEEDEDDEDDDDDDDDDDDMTEEPSAPVGGQLRAKQAPVRK